MEKEIICISCPVGCHLRVRGAGSRNIEVTGNQCARGEIYGKEEFLAPARIVTAVIRTDSAANPYAPVKTDKPVLREYIPGLLKELYGMKVSIPVKCGDIVIQNYHDTNVNVVLTRTVREPA